MDNLKAVLKTIRQWPLVGALLDLLSRERVVVLLLSLVAFYFVPTIPNLSPVWAERLSNIVFYGGGIILLGLSAESLIETKAGLPTTLEDFGGELLKAVGESVKAAEISPITLMPTLKPAEPISPQG